MVAVSVAVVGFLNVFSMLGVGLLLFLDPSVIFFLQRDHLDIHIGGDIQDKILLLVGIELLLELWLTRDDYCSSC